MPLTYAHGFYESIENKENTRYFNVTENNFIPFTPPYTGTINPKLICVDYVYILL